MRRINSEIAKFQLILKLTNRRHVEGSGAFLIVAKARGKRKRKETKGEFCTHGIDAKGESNTTSKVIKVSKG